MNNVYPISMIVLFLFLLLFVRLILYKEVDEMKMVIIGTLLPLCYILSFFTTESPEGSWNMLIRLVSYTAFFLLLYWSTKQLNVRKWLPIVFQLTGLWIALHMLFIHVGWLSFSNSVVAERFAGVFQYPNTFAMVMALFFIFSLSMLTNDDMSWKESIYYSLPMLLYMVCFLMAYSRTMLLIFPVVWVVGLLLLPIKKQLAYVWHTIVTLSFALLVVSLSQHTDFINMWLLTFFVVLSVLLHIGWRKVMEERIFTREKVKSLFNRRASRFYFPIAVGILGIALALDLMFNGLVYHALPSALQKRVDDISLSSATAQERFIFIEDAFHMSQQSPMIGSGGEAWATTYKKFQQTPYISNKIHNGYMEWLVDNGWLGLMIFIGVFGYLIYFVYRSRLRNQNDSAFTAIILSLFIVFAHSFFDFNFSYGTVWFLVFWIIVMGLRFGDEHETKKSNHIKSKEKGKGARDGFRGGRWFRLSVVTLSAFALVVTVCLVFSFRFMYASQDYEKARETQSLTNKKESLEAAVKKNPYHPTYRMHLSDVYRIIFENYHDAEYKQQAFEQIEKSIDLEPNNPDVWIHAGALAAKLDAHEQAIAYYDEALKKDYFNKTLYEKNMELKVDLGLASNEGKMNIFQSVIEDYSKAVQLHENLLSRSLDEAFNSREFEVSSPMHYYASLAYFKVGDYDEVSRIYHAQKERGEEDIRLRAMTILAYESAGEHERALELYDGSGRRELEQTVKSIKNKIN